MADIRSSVNKLPFIGGFTEALFGSPEQEEMQRQMARTAQAYKQYRPQIMQTGMNAFGNQAHAFTPVNNLIGDMYGQQYVPDMSQIVQNPFPDSMRQGMYQDAFAGKGPKPANVRASPVNSADPRLQSKPSGMTTTSGYRR